MVGLFYTRRASAEVILIYALLMVSLQRYMRLNMEAVHKLIVVMWCFGHDTYTFIPSMREPVVGHSSWAAISGNTNCLFIHHHI